MKTNVFDTFQSVLIIGNGFDKSCGLKTGYIDVYEQYIKIPSDNKAILEFKRDISNNFENWSDFEEGMAEYAKRFDSEDDFILCLNDFNAFMHEYLNGVQKNFAEEWDKEINYNFTMHEFTDSISKLGFGVSHNVDNLLAARGVPNILSMGIISLNYTEIFDMLYKSFYSPGGLTKPIHVHGILGDDPILGMDRIEQLKVQFDISDRVQRHFIKPTFNREYDSERVTKAENMIRNANVIFVFGASLGESDLTWRELLATWIQSDKDHHLFIYDYANSKKSFRTVSEKLDYEIIQKQNLLTNWGLSNKEISLNQLHLPCGISLFKIDEAIKMDLEKNDSFLKNAEKRQMLREKIANMDLE